MGAVTSYLVPGNDNELDFVNIFVILGGLFVSSIMIAVYALQGIGPQNKVDIGLAFLAVIFLIMGIVGVVIVHLTSGTFLRSSSTLGEASFSVWVGMLSFTGPTLLTNIRLNAFAPPTKGYALSALSGQKPPVRGIVNGVWAPSGENLALLGFAAALTAYLYLKTKNILIAAIGGTTPFAIIFAYLHGVASPRFYLIAACFMFVWGVYLFGTDLGAELPFTQYLPITFGLFWGMHRGVNISQFGGLIEWYTTILSAPEPLIYAAYYIVITDALTALIAILYVVDKLYTARQILG